MAKNFVQEGKTIHLVNAGQEPILSGAAVVVGELIAIAITDIPGGDTGDGLTEGYSNCRSCPLMKLKRERRCISRRARYSWKQQAQFLLGLPGKMRAQTVPSLTSRSMPNPFDKMAARMDAATLKKMGKEAVINGISVDVVPAELLEEMGALSGAATVLVVFAAGYRPARNDAVEYDGKDWIVTRYQFFNGKPQIWLE